MDESYRRVMAELKRRGMTQAAFCRRLGITAQQLNHWRLRRVPPKAYPEIAVVLGKSMEWVAGLAPEDEDTSPPLSPMARTLAAAYDRIESESARLAAFVQVIELLARIRDGHV